MDKVTLRAQARRWRKDLDPQVLARGIEQALRHLVQQEVWQRSQTVALYAALPGEPDLGALQRAAWDRGARVALPVVARRHAPLVWREHLPGQALIPGNFRVPEPPAHAPQVDPATVDLIVVPALRVDDRGFRIGYGGGYYDRSLPLMLRAHRVWVGLDAQRLPQVPTEPFDRPVHAWCTPSGYRTVPDPEAG